MPRRKKITAEAVYDLFNNLNPKEQNRFFEIMNMSWLLKATKLNPHFRYFWVKLCESMGKDSDEIDSLLNKQNRMKPKPRKEKRDERLYSLVRVDGLTLKEASREAFKECPEWGKKTKDGSYEPLRPNAVSNAVKRHEEKLQSQSHSQKAFV